MNERGTDALARSVSIVLHPFVVLAALALLATWQLERAAIWSVAAGVTLVVALTWVFVLQRWRSGNWTTVDASDRRERPLLYAVLFVLLTGFWLWLGRSAVADGVFAIVAMLCTAAVLNRWIKLSLHMASLAFAAISAFPLQTLVGVGGFVLLPVLAWARLRMARHTWAEVLGGTALGAVFAFVLQRLT